MGANRDFERDENLDFSDLSDSNQAKLANEQKSWGTAESIRGDDGYNPSALANAEKSSVSVDSNSGISDSETLSKDSQHSKSGGWQNNVSGGGTHKSRNAANSKGSWKNRAKSFFKSKGAMAATGGLIGGGGTFIFVISTGIASLAPVHIQEIITEKLNSASTSMNNRSSKILGLKMKGIKCTAGIVCRMSHVTERNVKNLERAGFKVEFEEGGGIFGRKKISKLTYIKDGNNISIPNDSKAIKEIMRTNPTVRHAYRRGFSGRFASFLDKSWQKLKGWFKFKKAKKDNKGKTEEEIDEDIKQTANNHSKEEETDTRKLPGDSEEVEEGGKSRVSKGEKGTKQLKEDLKSFKDKLKKGTKSLSEKGKMGLEILEKSKGSLVALGGIDLVCGAYNLISMGWSVAKIAKVEVFAQFGLSFLSMASKIKSGEATQQEVTSQGNNLMGIANKKDSKENKNPTDSGSNTSRLKNAFAFFADSTADNDKIKSATESQGWRAVAYDDRVSKLNDSAKDYQVGITGWFANLMNIMTTGLTGWVVRQGCKLAGVVSAAVGIAYTAFTILACMGTGFFGCIGQVIKKAAWIVALQVAIGFATRILTDKALGEVSRQVAEGLTGTILNNSTTGENFGNAIMSGSGAMMAKNTMAGSGGVLTKAQAVAFRQETERQIAQNAEEIRMNSSPFDPTTRHTFVGSIVSNMLPYAKQLSSISGFLPSLIGGAQRSFASITPGASAANSANFAANMETCEDKSITDTGAATDIFCNVYTGIDMGIVEKETDEIINELKDSGDIIEKENTSETDDVLSTVQMSGKLKEYEKYCFNRKAPVGVQEDEDDETLGGICNTTKNPKANLYAMFLTDVRTERGMNEDFRPDTNGGGVGTEGGRGSASAGGPSSEEISKAKSKFAPPLEGELIVTSPYGPRNLPIDCEFNGCVHTGADLGGAEGTPVYAVADGVVSDLSGDSSRGCGPNLRIISHKEATGSDIDSLYCHMSAGYKNPGDSVKKGDMIGRIGGWGANGPNTFPPHLHLEFYKGRAVYGGNHFDPMSIIGK